MYSEILKVLTHNTLKDVTIIYPELMITVFVYPNDNKLHVMQRRHRLHYNKHHQRFRSLIDKLQIVGYKEYTDAPELDG